MSAEAQALTTALTTLLATIEARRGAEAASSYTAKLLAGGVPGIAKKLGEEAVETALAAALHDKAAVVKESADLLYHWLVLLAALDIPLGEIATELDRRQAQSGLAEKASRPRP